MRVPERQPLYRWILWLVGTCGTYERGTLAKQVKASRPGVYLAHARLVSQGLIRELPRDPIPDGVGFESIDEWERARDDVLNQNRRRLPNGRIVRSVRCQLTEAGKVKFREEFPGHEPREDEEQDRGGVDPEERGGEG